MHFAPSRLLLVSLLLSAATSAWADRFITAPKFLPNTLILNTPTMVTIQATVSPDPALMPNTVAVVTLSPAGQSLAAPGLLYDDGTHGDAVAGDNIYTG